MTGFLDEWAQSAARIETQKRRLECLVYLARLPGYEAAAQLLRFECHRVGVPTTEDQIAAALSWLADQDLVTLRGEEAPVARLTAAGREVAFGQVTYPGVLRPDP